MTTSRSDARAQALATLDAWLAATDPVTGHLRPGDPDYWPPPVTTSQWMRPRAERITPAYAPVGRPQKAFHRRAATHAATLPLPGLYARQKPSTTRLARSQGGDGSSSGKTSFTL